MPAGSDAQFVAFPVLLLSAAHLIDPATFRSANYGTSNRNWIGAFTKELEEIDPSLLQTTAGLETAQVFLMSEARPCCQQPAFRGCAREGDRGRE
jgi:hypothetical protein